MLVNGPTPPNGGDAHAAARHAARGAFGSRAAVAAAVVATFAALAWADATALWGARPAWWLLPVAFTLAGLGAAELAALPAPALRATKRLFYRTLDVDLARAMQLAHEAHGALRAAGLASPA